MEETSPDKLRLVALDAEDLAVVSTYLQDAVTRVGDLVFLPKEKRFAAIANRFVWEKAGKSRKKDHERRRTALHFDRVLKAQTKNILRNRPDGVLNLLAIRFEETDAPAGTIDLVFSGDGLVRLEVECIEAQMSDLGGAWETQNLPSHDLDDA